MPDSDCADVPHPMLEKRSWVTPGHLFFSYGHSQLDTIVRYIENQEKHHRRRSFRDEYLTLLRKFEIEFREEYVFEFYDEHLFHRSEEWDKTLHS